MPVEARRLEDKEDEERRLVVAQQNSFLGAIGEVKWCLGIVGSFCVRCPFDYLCTFPRLLTL